MAHLESERFTPPSTPPPRKFGLRWTDFQYEGGLEDIPHSAKLSQKMQTPPSCTAAKLREERLRFTKKIPDDLNSKVCCPRDRSAVLEVYTEALEKINSENHVAIYEEANEKIRTILSIITAGPRNEVFYPGLLAPIEPLYARPRIEFRKDKYGHRAATRIHEWRNDGWPSRYPRNAIQEEKNREGRMKMWFEEDWTDNTIGGLDKEKEEEEEAVEVSDWR